ncbi:N-acetylmuramoyl-L-alanine amidase A [Streptomyces sp. enrichment culture]|uniref:N-acetylmuramoyl-L-alanine amidase n=1 Tax=Streptomyces sp. enrichment culture TaxID=1795815 RepID=UPI003F55FD2C
MDRTPSLPSRRGILAGAALTAVASPLFAPARAAAAPHAVDHRGAAWHPASRANYTPSNRPRAHPLHYVIIHVAQTTYAGTLSVFRDPAKKVSAHYVVRSSDGHVAQCVREADIAWHAGNWDYNTRSIGIEHEGWVDRPRYFTDVMYERSARLTAAICERYGIPRDRAHIIGHHEVPGSDHTDPGRRWDWKHYLRLVKSA